MKYLITGATGFIGPHLVSKLAGQGHICRCLVRSSSDTDALKELGVELVEGDITRSETLRGIADGMDRVIHMATLGHMKNFTVSESMFEDINVQGTIHVMEEALRAGVRRVVHCSSTAAMGICEDIPATEESRCRPHHPYGRSKLKAEKEVLTLVRQKKLPAVIIRFSMVYGPGEAKDILKLARLSKKGLFPKIGNRPKLTPLIQVEDAIQGLLLAVESEKTGQVYLITNREPFPFDEIGLVMRKALGKSPRLLYVPERSALLIASVIENIYTIFGKEPPVGRKNIESTLADRVFSSDKAQRELGFKPDVDPRLGLSETVEWYQKKGWI